ncbi:MAG: hypothetical protein OEQ53_07355, partial [Saprospiraceae bacterium]|nr:hypothetical protein [Saprospiraceae bacterium]
INVSAFGEGEDGRVFCLRRNSTNGRLIEIVDASAVACSAICKVTNANDSGSGSLRSSIGCAQNGDTICFDESLYNNTILLDSALVIGKNVVIETSKGLNLWINGTGLSNTLQVTSNGQVTIHGLSIVGGNGSNGVIWNQGDLTLVNTVVYGDMSAGAIFLNEGTLKLDQSTGILLQPE